MLLRNLWLYGCLVLLCQLVLSCSAENSSPADRRTDQAQTAQSSGAEAVDDSTRHIIAFGDSLFAGYGLNPSEGLVPQLQSALREKGYAVSVRNAAVTGDTSAAGRARLNFVLDSVDEDIELVILGLGGNDMLRGISPKETRANLTAMLDELQKRDIDVVLTGMIAAPNLGELYAKQFNSIYPDLAKKYDTQLYPFILDGVVTDSNLMLPDNIHPNAKGVDKMTANLLPVVTQRLGEPAAK